MFKKLRQRVRTIEAVIDAMVTLLSSKSIMTREDIQNEILRDAIKRGRKMNKCFLYELEKGAKIYGLAVLGEPETERYGNVLVFDKLDGMFSNCHVLGKPEKVVHLSANLELEKYKDGWKTTE